MADDSWQALSVIVAGDLPSHSGSGRKGETLQRDDTIDANLYRILKSFLAGESQYRDEYTGPGS